jgi:hypothetical protein
MQTGARPVVEQIPLLCKGGQLKMADLILKIKAKMMPEKEFVNAGD